MKTTAGIDRTLLRVEHRARPADVQARLQERDQRLARDTRTEAQKLLNEPEPSRSALALKSSNKIHRTVR